MSRSLGKKKLVESITEAKYLPKDAFKALAKAIESATEDELMDLAVATDDPEDSDFDIPLTASQKKAADQIEDLLDKATSIALRFSK